MKVTKAGGCQFRSEGLNANLACTADVYLRPLEVAATRPQPRNGICLRSGLRCFCGEVSEALTATADQNRALPERCLQKSAM